MFIQNIKLLSKPHFSYYENNKMERWRGKIAVVTGASSGIGAAAARGLALAGVITIGLARRKERIDEIINGLPKEGRKNLYAIKCDISNEQNIVKTFREIEERFKGVDILVNNAGISKGTLLIDPTNSDAIQAVVNTNLMGLIFCTREAVQIMRKRNTDGHIIHINSVLGHNIPIIPELIPLNNVYAATKYAVTAVTETHRQEFINMGTKIKVTSISPGLVDTEISDLKKLTNFPSLESEDIADAILYVLGTPPHVQVYELTIKPFDIA